LFDTALEIKAIELVNIVWMFFDFLWLSFMMDKCFDRMLAILLKICFRASNKEGVYDRILCEIYEAELPSCTVLFTVI
jgi:hypothetical protein